MKSLCLYLATLVLLAVNSNAQTETAHRSNAQIVEFVIGIQEKAVLGSSMGAASAILGGTSSEAALTSKEGREMKGYLKKWTNYTGGYKLRWFVLEDGVLSYYKHQGKGYFVHVDELITYNIKNF